MNTQKYNTSAVAWVAYLGCAFFGVTMFFIGALLPSFIQMVEGAASLPWVLTLGIIAGTVICGAVMDRYGYKWLLIASSLALAAGLLGFRFTGSLPVLFACVFLIGAGGGVLNSETIALISDIYGDDKRGGRLSLLGGFYCIGSLLWTLICRYFVTSDNYTVPMVSSAAVIALLSVAFMFVRFPDAKHTASAAAAASDSAGEGNRNTFAQAVQLFKYQLLVIVAIVLFIQGALESISQSFTTSYLTVIEGGIDSSGAAVALIWMTVGMAAGRFSLPLAIKYLGNRLSLCLFLTVAIVGALIIHFAHGSVFYSSLALGCTGFGIGVTAPVVFNYLGQVFKKNSGAAVSLTVMAAQIGMLLASVVAGKWMFAPKALERGGFKVIPFVICALAVLVMLLFPLVVKSTAKTKQKNLDI